MGKWIRGYRRGLLTGRHAGLALVEMCRNSDSNYLILIAELKDSDIPEVYSYLMGYPRTELVWSLLPNQRSEYYSETLSCQEIADINQRQYQEDRDAVEHLRNLILERLKALS